MNIEKKYGKGAELIWSDRKRRFGQPLSFTRYRLIKKPGAWCKLFSDIGLTFSEIEEVNLYRIRDISMHQSFFGKMLNVGTIVLKTAYDTQPTITLRNIKNPFQVRDMLTDYVEKERQVHNVHVTEFQSRNW